MTTIGVNLSHNASICIKDKNKLEYYEEDRFNKIKNWAPVYNILSEDFDFKSFSKIKDFNSNFIFCGFDLEDLEGGESGEGGSKIPTSIVLRHKKSKDHPMVKYLVDKYKIKNWVFNVSEHHLYHVCSGFYFSKFEDALVIVSDGAGGRLERKGKCSLADKMYQEADSVYYITPIYIEALYKHYSLFRGLMIPPDREVFKDYIKNLNYKEKPAGSVFSSYYEWNGLEYKFSVMPNPGNLFGALCVILGHPNGFSAGKVMGLSSYGKEEGERDEDLAKQVQIATEEYTMKLIEKALSKKNCKNIILSGGYALNCVNNYKYTQEFKDINFFIDPAPHDGGTAIGAAVWFDHYRNTTS